MNPEVLIPLGVITTAFAAYVGHRMMRPKILAEARKANADAASTEWKTLKAEIDRLSEQVTAQGETIAAMQKDRAALALIAEERDRENRTLRSKLVKLEKRLTAIEALFKLHPITAEMQAALDALSHDD